MTSYFTDDNKGGIPITRVPGKAYKTWAAGQSDFIKNWLSSQNVKGSEGEILCIPGSSGRVEQVVFVAKENPGLWDYAALANGVRAGIYVLDDSFDTAQATAVFLGWGLSAYRFDRYSKKEPLLPQLCVRADVDLADVQRQIDGTYLVRDLINTPANDMGPVELAEKATEIARAHKAELKIIIGEDLLKANYPAVYTVGMASDRAPRLIDMRWGSEKDPKVTLVGKGVCFDSGGLDIKPSSGMLTMKKDMGGSAHVLALAQMIMEAKLPVRLRVLVPAVENSISGNAYRPMDVIKMRSGKTVEVGNTDAEGRLVLADALHEADSEKPQLIIDCATLTGAARVAMGAEVGVLFSNDDKVAQSLVKTSHDISDPLWQMPLWEGYRSHLKSKVADISSTGSSAYGGAITAALFLSEFLPNKTPWVHLDIMAWNNSDKPGRHEGGEAMGLRTLYAYVKKIAEE
jgi:leucyl aminopeptidase